MMPVAPQPPMPMMPMPAQQMTPAQEYHAKAMQILPSIQPNNKVYKRPVGELIYPFLSKMVPAENVPRLTGMLIELPIEQVREFLSSFQVLTEMALEGNQIVEQQKLQQQQA
mmetsp:Transcript_5466/g.9252  ORF Transcript_5466/g.9252 Transcript_5466/m.9252 type:complete len:112 (-) Transcript_5466:42-377(-)